MESTVAEFCLGNIVQVVGGYHEWKIISDYGGKTLPTAKQQEWSTRRQMPYLREMAE